LLLVTVIEEYCIETNKKQKVYCWWYRHATVRFVDPE
jgi:hypothetical protein